MQEAQLLFIFFSNNKAVHIRHLAITTKTTTAVGGYTVTTQM